MSFIVTADAERCQTTRALPLCQREETPFRKYAAAIGTLNRRIAFDKVAASYSPTIRIIIKYRNGSLEATALPPFNHSRGRIARVFAILNQKNIFKGRSLDCLHELGDGCSALTKDRWKGELYNLHTTQD